MEVMPSTIGEVLHFFGSNAMKAVAMPSSFIGRLQTRMSPPAPPPVEDKTQPTAGSIQVAPG